MEKTVAVVGGGISGMGFAHYCTANGFKATVFEKNEIGGCLQSVALNKDAYYELGGHTLTHTYTSVLEILKYYGKTDVIREKGNLKFELYTQKGFKSLFSRIQVLSLLASLPGLGFISKNNLSLASYYGKVLGKKNYKNLFSLLFRAILCQEPDNFPAEKLFKKRNKDKTFPKKYVLEKGVQQLLEIIGTNPNITCKENTTVTAISKHDDTYRIWSNNELLMEASILALACPANVAAKLLDDGYPSLANHLRAIEQVSVETALLEVLDENTPLFRKKSILGADNRFYSAIRIPENKGNPLHWCFYFPADTYSKTEKMNILAEVFQVAPEKIQVKATRTFQLPGLTVANLSAIAAIEREIKDTNLFFSTNYMDGLSIEDCCVRAKSEAERLVALTAK